MPPSKQILEDEYKTCKNDPRTTKCMPEYAGSQWEFQKTGHPKKKAKSAGAIGGPLTNVS